AVRDRLRAIAQAIVSRRSQSTDRVCDRRLRCPVDDLTRLPETGLASGAARDLSATPSTGADWGRFAPGTIFAGRFRIVAPLGRGGMGEVYRADDLTLGQTVALKLLPDDLAGNPARLAQFHNEVRVARTISHRNV